MSDPAERARYQRLRLRLGILGIGLILVSLWVSLGLRVPSRLDRLLADWGPWAGFGAGAILGLGAALLQLLPDVLARHADLNAGVALGDDQRSFLRRYWGGVAAWVVQVTVAGGLAGFALAPRGTLEDSTIGYGVVAAAMCVLSARRLFRDPTLAIESEPYEVLPSWIEALDWRLGRAGETRPALRWFDHGETSLAGGWEGFGPRQRLTLSRSVAELPPEVAAGLILREIGHRRKLHRWVSCGVSAAWLVAGVALAWSLERWVFGPLGTAGRVFLLAAAMSTWSWVGLFVLPALGRRQVTSADRFMAERLGDAAETSAVFAAIAGSNLPDESLSRAKGYVFHPIPPLVVRRAAALSALNASPASS